ncbi:hypothetical protein NKR23_g11246 [Pleurostoma richardsiae]|uniref:Uncharacterized protein n=1 Tax=Pleurostoma richardsiae TaxID=41990 RepID=A0AA38RCG6_9PEZI|nr:hypothetical protein NKR23_g11246 [Pleurostoma richardsiae]
MPSLKHKKAWVLTPNQDYTATGVLQIGQVLTDYMDPNSAVLHSGTYTIPEETLLDQSTHRGVDGGSMETHQVAFRAWVKESLVKAVGGNVNVQSERLHWEKYISHTISVFIFQPSTQYCKESLALGDAPLKTAPPWYKTHRRVWLVTGLRILGKGAKVTHGFIKNSIQGGVHGGVSSGQANTHSIDDTDAFVYAYRLHEIIVRRKLDDTECQAFTGGQIYDIGGDDSDDGDEGADNEPEVVGYEVLSVEDEPYYGDGDKNNPMFVD